MANPDDSDFYELVTNVMNRSFASAYGDFIGSEEENILLHNVSESEDDLEPVISEEEDETSTTDCPNQTPKIPTDIPLTPLLPPPASPTPVDEQKHKNR